MSLALLMSAVAQAQTTHLKITVPFDFVAGTSSSLPPNMKSRPSDLGGTTLSVHNVNSDAVTLVLSISCRSQKPGVNAKLVFYRYGQQYFLAEVWNRNSAFGNQIKIDSRQTATTGRLLDSKMRRWLSSLLSGCMYTCSRRKPSANSCILYFASTCSF